MENSLSNSSTLICVHAKRLRGHLRPACHHVGSFIQAESEPFPAHSPRLQDVRQCNAVVVALLHKVVLGGASYDASLCTVSCYLCEVRCAGGIQVTELRGPSNSQVLSYNFPSPVGTNKTKGFIFNGLLQRVPSGHSYLNEVHEVLVECSCRLKNYQPKMTGRYEMVLKNVEKCNSILSTEIVSISSKFISTEDARNLYMYLK